MNSSTVPLARATAADWVELAKPRITTMVVFTALVGFVTASTPSPRTFVLAAPPARAHPAGRGPDLRRTTHGVRARRARLALRTSRGGGGARDLGELPLRLH